MKRLFLFVLGLALCTGAWGNDAETTQVLDNEDDAGGTKTSSASAVLTIIVFLFFLLDGLLGVYAVWLWRLRRDLYKSYVTPLQSNFDMGTSTDTMGADQYNQYPQYPQYPMQPPPQPQGDGVVYAIQE